MDSMQPTSPPRAISARGERNSSMVIICGLATTAMALFGIYILDVLTDDFHVMGWYANYVIPAGAILVGLVASSGYGIASWISGFKITRKLLWTMLALQFIAYFAAQYIEFHGLKLIHRDGKPVGFLEYYDLIARSFAWKQSNGSRGEPLGGWGYAFRALEILGFVGGSLVVPILMAKAPYCEKCQRYQRRQQFGFLAGSVPAKKVKKSDQAGLAAYEAEQQQAFAQGQKTLEELTSCATENKTGDFQNFLTDLKTSKKQTMKLPGRFAIELVHCKQCYAGWLETKFMWGYGNHVRVTQIARKDLQVEFVRSVSA
jgi:hypothetical protein